MFVGIGGLFPKLALHSLWNISKDKAESITDTLCEYGLLSQMYVVLPSFCITRRYQDCVITHAVVSKYIFDIIMTKEIQYLSPYISSVNSIKQILQELTILFKKCYGADDLSILTPKEYLTYTLHLIEHVIIPFYLKLITMHALHDPHLMLLMLQKLIAIINSSYNEADILLKFYEKIVKLHYECNVLLRKAYDLNRALHRKVEQHLFSKNYEALIQTLGDYFKSASFGLIASKCIELTKEIIPHTENRLIKEFELFNERVILKTPEYHSVNLEKLPLLKRYISLHQEVDTVLRRKGDEIWELYSSLAFEDKLSKEFESIIQNYYSTLQVVAPTVSKSIRLSTH